jgi:hypothetical protein
MHHRPHCTDCKIFIFSIFKHFFNFCQVPVRVTKLFYTI